MKDKKAKNPLAMAKREELSLQALAQRFEGLIRGIQEQQEVLAEAGMSDEVAALAEAELEGAIERRDELADLIRRMEHEAGYFRQQAKQRDERARNLEHLAGKIKFALQLYMEMKGIQEVQGFAYRFKLHKNPPSVVIVDEQRLPDEFVEYQPRVDRAKVLEALKAGKEVPGAALREKSYRLEVK
jgi:hypothetical protein